MKQKVIFLVGGFFFGLISFYFLEINFSKEKKLLNQTKIFCRLAHQKWESYEKDKNQSDTQKNKEWNDQASYAQACTDSLEILKESLISE